MHQTPIEVALETAVDLGFDKTTIRLIMQHNKIEDDVVDRENTRRLRERYQVCQQHIDNGEYKVITPELTQAIIDQGIEFQRGLARAKDDIKHNRGVVLNEQSIAQIVQEIADDVVPKK